MFKVNNKIPERHHQLSYDRFANLHPGSKCRSRRKSCEPCVTQLTCIGLLKMLKLEAAIRGVLLKKMFLKISQFFFLSGFSFTDTDDSQDSRGREGTIFYSTLPHPPAHKHSDIYLQLWMCDDYHALLIASLVFIRLLLDEIYHLVELPFN